MAQSLDADPRLVYHPLDFAGDDEDVENSLYALNMFRVGYVKEALRYLKQPAVMIDRRITDYPNDRKKFHKQMHCMADDLEAVGL